MFPLSPFEMKGEDSKIIIKITSKGDCLNKFSLALFNIETGISLIRGRALLRRRKERRDQD